MFLNRVTYSFLVLLMALLALLRTYQIREKGRIVDISDYFLPIVIQMAHSVRTVDEETGHKSVYTATDTANGFVLAKSIDLLNLKADNDTVNCTLVLNTEADSRFVLKMVKGADGYTVTNISNKQKIADYLDCVNKAYKTGNE